MNLISTYFLFHLNKMERGFAEMLLTKTFVFAQSLKRMIDYPFNDICAFTLVSTWKTITCLLLFTNNSHGFSNHLLWYLKAFLSFVTQPVVYLVPMNWVKLDTPCHDVKFMRQMKHAIEILRLTSHTIFGVIYFSSLAFPVWSNVKTC